MRILVVNDVNNAKSNNISQLNQDYFTKIVKLLKNLFCINAKC